MKIHAVLRLTFIAVVGMLPMMGFAQDKPDKADRLTREWKDADGNSVPCQIYLPLHYDQSKKYPLVLCLHGAGGLKNSPFTAQTAASTMLMTAEMREKYPAFILIPQTNKGWVKIPEHWNNITTLGIHPEGPALTLVLQGLAELMKEYSVDSDRIYVTGQSMGGFGTWSLLEHHPEIFAAAVPICGVGDPTQAAKIRCPVWVFHGAKDSVVPVACSRDMVEAMKKAGLEVKYTEYPEGQHVVWTQAWSEDELTRWLFAQQRKK